MPSTFSFEAKEQYKTFAGRQKAVHYSIWYVYAAMLAVGLGLLIFLPVFIWINFLGFLILGGCAIFIYVDRRVRNYIIKLTYENGIINIDYALYNSILHFSGKPQDFSIERKLNDPYWQRYYILYIKSLKDNWTIEQIATLEWNRKLMEKFIKAING